MERQALEQSSLFGEMPIELIARIMRFACGLDGRVYLLRKRQNDDDHVLTLDYTNKEQHTMTKVCKPFKSIAQGLYNLEFEAVHLITDSIEYPNMEENISFDQEWIYKGCHIQTLRISNVPNRIYLACYGQFTVDHVIINEVQLTSVMEKFAILAAFISWGVKTITYVKLKRFQPDTAHEFKDMFNEHGFKDWTPLPEAPNSKKAIRIDADPDACVPRLRKILENVLELQSPDSTKISDKSFWLRYGERGKIIVNLPRHFFDRLETAFNQTSDQYIDLILNKLRKEVERCKSVEIDDCVLEYQEAVIDICGEKLTSVNLVEAEPWILERELESLSVLHMIHQNPEKAINTVCKEWAYCAAEVNKWSIGFDRHLALGLILHQVPNIDYDIINKNTIIRDNKRMCIDVRGCHIVLEVKAYSLLLTQHNDYKRLVNEVDMDFNASDDEENERIDNVEPDDLDD